MSLGLRLYGSVPVRLPAAESVRLDNSIPTFTAVDTWYQSLPGRLAEGDSFVPTYVLGVSCVVYIKGLCES